MSTHNIPLEYKKENHPNCPKCNNSAAVSKGFEIFVVNQPSVFEPLKFCCSIVL